jgi:hypothetical protein
MINILSIRCSLAFAPYLAESATEFLREGGLASRVVRQGGSGLIIRSDGDVVLRHQNRQATLSREDATHYAATVQFRCEVYDVLRMQDEVVLANVGNELLLSHPQSDLWLGSDAIAALTNAFNSESGSKADETRASLPDWLSVSTGGGRLLLSDQRTARWVLLGADHIRELERRLEALRVPTMAAPRLEPPTISVKGLTVHLQSAFKLAATLEEFAKTGNAEPFEEITPIYSLTASRSTEGIELKDSDNRVAITAREARKWAGVIRGELDRLNVRQVERGGIRTVIATNEHGRWFLQWGDEVYLSHLRLLQCIPYPDPTAIGLEESPIIQGTGEFQLLLSPETGACVALTQSDLNHLRKVNQ